MEIDIHINILFLINGFSSKQDLFLKLGTFYSFGDFNDFIGERLEKIMSLKWKIWLMD
jgi:hypothetical protein